MKKNPVSKFKNVSTTSTATAATKTMSKWVRLRDEVYEELQKATPKKETYSQSISRFIKEHYELEEIKKQKQERRNGHD